MSSRWKVAELARGRGRLHDCRRATPPASRAVGRNAYGKRQKRVASAGVVAMLLLVCPQRVPAFSVLFQHGSSAAELASTAARWSAEPDPFGRGTGLHDGIQVAVEANFAANLGADVIAGLYHVSESLITEKTEAAVRAALRMWETPALRFDVAMGGPAVEGPSVGMEIDLFARSFPTDTFFGYTDVSALPAAERLLTNGQRFAGDVIVGADVYINRDRILGGAQILAAYGVPLDSLQAALQILIAHEVGHAIGLAHPNQATFLDTDSDPFNVMRINPFDPFGDLIISSISPNISGMLWPIMWGGVSQADPSTLLALIGRLSNPVLTADDRAGRDVLYPAFPFTCYSVRRPEGTAPFAPVLSTALQDAFENATVDVRRPARLCNRVQAQDASGADGHVEYVTSYAFTHPPGGSRFVRVRGQQLADQVGDSLLINVAGSDRLQVPSTASRAGMPAQSAPSTDYFNCHRIVHARGSKPFQIMRNIVLRDEFGSRRVDIGRPIRLCAPADVNGAEPGAEGHRTSLMCYLLRPSRAEPPSTSQGPYYVNNSMGAQSLEVVRPVELCVPAQHDP